MTGVPSPFAGEGEMQARCRAMDWAATPLGPVERWPAALRWAVRTCLDSPFPINLWCGPELVLIYNDGYRHVLGAKHPDALGRPGSEVWAEIWGQIEPMFAEIGAGGPAAYADDAPFVVERADGANPTGEPNAWFTFSLSAVRDDDGQVVAYLNIVSETTRRLQAERATEAALAKAERAEARLRDVFAQAPAFMAVLRDEDFVFEYANAAYFQLVGHRDILGKGVFDALPEVRGQGFDALLRGVVESGEPYIGREVPVFLQRTAGAEPEQRFVDLVYYPITEADGSRSGVVAHGSDVTDQVRARQEVETQRARLEQIFAEAPAVMALYTGPEHIVTLVNPTWETTLGKPDSVGRRFRDVFPEFEPTGLFQLLDRVYETGEPFVDPEINVPLERFGSGTLEDTYWHLVWRPLAGSAEHGRDILVHAVEVTEQVRARREVERKAEELARLARALEATNRELDQFAYVASHDLKAPLRGIANLSQWIEEDLEGSLTEESRQNLGLLRGRVHRMEALINGILDYSRAGRSRGAAEAIDTGATVREVVELLDPPPETRIEIPDDMPTVHAERVPIEQIFMNLIGNALKYSAAVRSDVVVRLAWRDEGDFLRFSISDNGPGIAPEFHERVWTIFQTLEARDRVEGTGIGLSVVKKIVESRGGSAGIESAAGEGATFWFTWPKG